MEQAGRHRVVVTGTGFGCRIQVPGFRQSGRFEVVALVGRDGEKTRRVAEQLAVPNAFTRLEEALALPGVDAVSVAAPPFAHAEQVVAAARAGLHVLCEKPMARTLAEAVAMCEHASAAGIVALVDHEFRFHPARAELARLIARGDLGEPRLLIAADLLPLYIAPYRAAPAWWFDAGAGGGWLGASGSHLIDGVRVWLGEPTAVCALVERLGAPGSADDSFAMLARTAGGAQVVLQQSAAVFGPRASVLRIAGSEGSAWLDERWQLWIAGRSQEPSCVPISSDLALPRVEIPAGAGPFAARELPCFVRQAERFADAIDGSARDGPQAATFADGLACQRVMEAARASSREGRWIEIDGVARIASGPALG